ncbi:phosphotransferase [Paenibacillus sp. GYB006]|uniref:phosphotransferase n=1 Tax=Paenibacillus sp. GYB006 TaxID=2994394 RepID=UPI002F9611BB
MIPVETPIRIDQDKIHKITNHILQIEQGKIKEWTCTPISIDQLNFVTGGVYRVAGETEIGRRIMRQWSLIIKIVIADSTRDDPSHYNYWKREILAYESGLLDQLPGNLIAPECYEMEEKFDGTVWLWLEDMTGERANWKKENYAYAAAKLGEFHAAYVNEKSLPQHAWINKYWMRSWIRECDKYRNMPLRLEMNQMNLSNEVMNIIDKYEQFERKRNEYLIALESLPRTLSHQDFDEFNVLYPDKYQDEDKLAVIDWQFISISGVGEDLGRFLGLSMSRGNVPIDRLSEYRDLIFTSYIGGLRKNGWNGNEETARLGYLLSFAFRSVWEIPLMLRQLQQDKDSPESKRLIYITKLQMDSAEQAERLGSL